MSVFSRFRPAAAPSVCDTAAAQAQEVALSIAAGFGPTAEVPDPRAG